MLCRNCWRNGSKHPKLLSKTVDILCCRPGVIMQLTNIARDILEDAQIGRRYIPSTWLDIEPEKIAQKIHPIKRLFQELLKNYFH